MTKTSFSDRRKTVLIVLFIPSVERDGKTTIAQDKWDDEALTCFGKIFGGATAYPKAKGVWRDDERGGVLVKDEPVVIHCYITPDEIENESNLKQLRTFCQRMGIETN